jgi:glutamine amidotransferase
VKVGILDYGSGNLHSVSRAVAKLGTSPLVSSDYKVLNRCAALIVPGVGAFSACMASIKAARADSFITDWVTSGRALLGICVGHQVLFETGVEHGKTAAGLGFFDGVVEQLRAERLPHMGWNTVAAPVGSEMFAGIESERFYFVHSYGVHQSERTKQITWTEHEGDSFIAAQESDNIWSTQFHPEKSGAAGAQLLTNWLEFAENNR